MENRIKKEDVNNEFINGWKKSYDPRYDENVYFNNLIPFKNLTTDNIQKLFEWKNETIPIAEKKQKSLNKLKENLPEIQARFENSGSSITELNNIYSLQFFKSGYIWNLCFLHILKYDNCPIADKYVYCAYNYICNGKNQMPSSDWETYIKYRDFFNEIASETNRKSVKERKEIDEALWAFGKHLQPKKNACRPTQELIHNAFKHGTNL
ncbi:Uncharacterised protein [uncultured archaeon]|nr:Uncharacterised protein [uncultured archaeon]